jgi:drug/metabolite transporter (DMT)-like permease
VVQSAPVTAPVNIWDYEALAAERLDPGAHGYYAGGSGDELTLRWNVEAYRRWQLRPRVLVDVSGCTTATTVLGLLAYIAVAERGSVVRAFRAIGRGGIAIAALMAISSGSFIVALNHAPVASILFMQALAPLLAAAMGMALGERVSRRTWLAMGIAIGGVALMVGGPGRPGALGLGLSLLMTVAFAATLVITRHRRDVSMAPATCASQVVVFALAAPFSHPASAGAHDLGLLVALGIGQIGLGLVFLTIGGRLIPAAEVALITLLEVVLGPLWVWILLSEQPSAATLAGGAIVLGAVALQALSDSEPPTPPATT